MNATDEVGVEDPPESQPDPGLGERLNVEGLTRWIYTVGQNG
jgi:hypothetical protein